MRVINKLFFWFFLSLCLFGGTASLSAQSFQDLLNEFSQDVDSIESELDAPALLKDQTLPSDGNTQNFPSAQDTSTPSAMQETAMITLQGLDKQTARVYIIDAPIGKVIEFGTLRILVHRCLQSAPEDQPEAKAFIVISENKIDAPPQVLFSGWMFASSPAISALDHPVYDVWAKACKVTKNLTKI